MKKTKIAIATILILIIAVILVGVFFGFRVFGFGQPEYPNNAKPPSENATLWEKAEWEEHHGSICQCSGPFEQVGPLSIFSSTNTTISKVSFNFHLVAGTIQHDMTKVNFTLSTTNAEKTVGYHDPAVNVSWSGSKTNKSDDIFEYYEQVHIELDTVKMGFTSSTFGRNQKFSLIVTPPVSKRYAITRITPDVLQPGVTMEIP